MKTSAPKARAKLVFVKLGLKTRLKTSRFHLQSFPLPHDPLHRSDGSSVNILLLSWHMQWRAQHKKIYIAFIRMRNARQAQMRRPCGAQVGLGGIERGRRWMGDRGWLPLLTWQFVICAGCCCDSLVFRISFSVPHRVAASCCIREGKCRQRSLAWRCFCCWLCSVAVLTMTAFRLRNYLKYFIKQQLRDRSLSCN